MRFCELASRVLASGIAMGPATSAAMAGTRSDDPPVPLSDRVFFDRVRYSPELGGSVRARRTQDRRRCRTDSPHGGAAEPVPAKAQPGAIVVAAVAPSKGGPLTDVGAAPPSMERSRRSAAAVEAGGKERSARGKLPVLEDPSLRSPASKRSSASAHTGPTARPCSAQKNLSEPSQPARSRNCRAEHRCRRGGRIRWLAWTIEEPSGQRAGDRVHHAVCQWPRDQPLQPGQAASRHRSRRRAGLARAGDDHRGRRSCSRLAGAVTAMP